jgi:Tfp pilus assembly protein PilF
MQSCQYARAIKEIKKAIEMDSLSAEAYLLLGDVYQAKGMKKEAEESWKKSLDISPNKDEVKKRLSTGSHC